VKGVDMVTAWPVDDPAHMRRVHDHIALLVEQFEKIADVPLIPWMDRMVLE